MQTDPLIVSVFDCCPGHIREEWQEILSGQRADKNEYRKKILRQRASMRGIGNEIIRVWTPGEKHVRRIMMVHGKAFPHLSYIWNDRFEDMGHGAKFKIFLVSPRTEDR